MSTPTTDQPKLECGATGRGTQGSPERFQRRSADLPIRFPGTLVDEESIVNAWPSTAAVSPQDLIAVPQQWLFEQWVQPLMFYLGWAKGIDAAFDATEWFVWGIYEVVFMVLVLGFLERWRPLESVSDPRAIRVDMLFTLLHRLGVFPLLAFAVLVPAIDAVEAALRMSGISRPNFDAWLPEIGSAAVLSWFAYLIVFDVVDYWIHRLQHSLRWWWELHAVHHSQRQMTYWSDQRNHLLDDLLRDALIALTALVIGAAPSQFVAFVVLSRILQSLQHANTRLRFAYGIDRLLVSPHFHRMHHAMGLGHEGSRQGCNFGVLFPWWDMLFGTARWDRGYYPTGIADQLQGRDYGESFWALHWMALRRLANREHIPDRVSLARAK